MSASPSPERVAQLLKCSIEEAEQVLADDKRIDKGEKLFELPEELKAGAKKARQAPRKVTAYNFTKRERKENSEKRELLAQFAGCVENVEILNPEREFVFTHNGTKYKIVMSCPRS